MGFIKKRDHKPIFHRHHRLFEYPIGMGGNGVFGTIDEGAETDVWQFEGGADMAFETNTLIKLNAE